VQAEQYDFIVPRSRSDRPAVIAFRKLLQEPKIRETLERLGMRPDDRVARTLSGPRWP
jgi:putative molybdopterin biosynthesis protein